MIKGTRIGHSPLLTRTSPSAYRTALFLTWHGVAGLRDTRRLSPVPVSLTLLLDHPRRAQPILNGLKHRTCAPNSFQHIVAPLTSIGAQQNLPVCGHARLQARHRPRWRGCHGRATPLNGRRLFSWHGRVALRDATVPDSTWHGVSGRGASEACQPILRSAPLVSSV